MLDADEARKKRQAGEPAVLVAGSLGPDNKEGMPPAGALVTGLDGLSSHDLVVLRGAGTPIVCGCEGMEVDVERGEVRFGERKVEAGEIVTVDGSGGRYSLVRPRCSVRLRAVTWRSYSPGLTGCERSR